MEEGRLREQDSRSWEGARVCRPHTQEQGGRLRDKAGNRKVAGRAGLCSYPWLPVLALDIAAGCWPWAATVPSLGGKQLSVIEFVAAATVRCESPKQMAEGPES